MRPFVSSASLRTQGRPLVGTTLLAAMILTAVLFLDVQGKKMDLRRTESAEIAVEHQGVLMLHVLQSAGKQRGIIEFRGEGGSVSLTLPVPWQQREVRGAALDAVKSAPENEGTRWILPAGVTLSLWIPDVAPLLIRNASEDALLVLGTRVHVGTGGKEEKSALVKEGAVRFW